MSSELVVLSSNDNYTATDGSTINGTNQSYRFSNSFSNPIELKEDSEVALVSLKAVRKDLTLDITSSNNTFWVRIGEYMAAPHGSDMAGSDLNPPLLVTLDTGTYTLEGLKKEVERACSVYLNMNAYYFEFSYTHNQKKDIVQFTLTFKQRSIPAISGIDLYTPITSFNQWLEVPTHTGARTLLIVEDPYGVFSGYATCYSNVTYPFDNGGGFQLLLNDAGGGTTHKREGCWGIVSKPRFLNKTSLTGAAAFNADGAWDIDFTKGGTIAVPIQITNIADFNTIVDTGCMQFYRDFGFYVENTNAGLMNANTTNGGAVAYAGGIIPICSIWDGANYTCRMVVPNQVGSGALATNTDWIYTDTMTVRLQVDGNGVKLITNDSAGTGEDIVIHDYAQSQVLYQDFTYFISPSMLWNPLKPALVVGTPQDDDSWGISGEFFIQNHDTDPTDNSGNLVSSWDYTSGAGTKTLAINPANAEGRRCVNGNARNRAVGAGVPPSNVRSGNLFSQKIYLVVGDNTAGGALGLAVSGTAQNLFGFSDPAPDTQYFGENHNEGYWLSDKNPLQLLDIRNNEVMLCRIRELNAKTHGLINQNDQRRFTDNILSMPIPKNFGYTDEDGVLFYEPAAPIYYPLKNFKGFRMNDLSVELVNLSTGKYAEDLEGNSVITIHIRSRS